MNSRIKTNNLQGIRQWGIEPYRVSLVIQLFALYYAVVIMKLTFHNKWSSANEQKAKTVKLGNISWN